MINPISFELFDLLLEKAKKNPPLPTAVICPDDFNSLAGTFLAMEHGIINPILIGNKNRIIQASNKYEKDISSLEIIDVEEDRKAAKKGVELVNSNIVKSIMKGNIHSDDLLSQIVKSEHGLKTHTKISHAFVLNVPNLNRLLFISDATINVCPDLITKKDITQNAINLAHACGIELPKVAIMSAVETININIPSSIEAAALSKMAERGQIVGAIVDGPLAMDNAINLEAAKSKNLLSPVAGNADILIVPNIESGNMLSKQLRFLSGALIAGLVLGAKVPVILTSRADDDVSRLISCALAQLYVAKNPIH